MPKCSKCAVLQQAYAQQASVIEALTRALDAVRPAAASLQHEYVPEPQPAMMQMPDTVKSSIVTVAGFEGPLRDFLENWALEAMASGMDEAEVARRIFEGDTE